MAGFKGWSCAGKLALACVLQVTVVATTAWAADDADHSTAESPRRGKVSQVTAAEELKWPLPPGVDKSYGSIDGQRMLRYVKEQAAISDKSRDEGNKFWGRIAGQKSGDETQAWVTEKLKALKLDVETRTIPMTTQNIPKD